MSALVYILWRFAMTTESRGDTIQCRWIRCSASALDRAVAAQQMFRTDPRIVNGNLYRLVVSAARESAFRAVTAGWLAQGDAENFDGVSRFGGIRHDETSVAWATRISYSEGVDSVNCTMQLRIMAALGLFRRPLYLEVRLDAVSFIPAPAPA